MLKHIYISQFALIDTLDLDLTTGFTVITGETGAGKSIIMGALGLIMGGRADSKSVRNGAAKSVVEATFLLETDELKPLFDTLELDYLPECIIRRELTASGKSRAFVNDTPVNLEQIKSITSRLIDIHSQYENLLLNSSDFQLGVVDSVAETGKELSEYKDVYARYNQKKQELARLRCQYEEWSAERDYAQFQFDQLSEVDLEEDEQTRLENEMDMLNHAEEIKNNISEAVSRLDDEQYGVLMHLREAQHSIERVARYSKGAEPVAERISSALIELRDINDELSAMFASLDYDPARKSWVEERLSLLYSLEQKHRVSTVAELIAIRDAFNEKLQRIDGFDSEIVEVEQNVKLLFESLSECAQKLTVKRRKVSSVIADYITKKLVLLGIPNAHIAVNIEPLTDFSPSGNDGVQILFSANKNTPLRPVASIASGGEIARVMLTIKALVARNSNLSTIIFDEIDTGVSGDIAQRMGNIMHEMSADIQVITITHLPQIAAQGMQHLKVYKEDDDNSTNTHIRTLQHAERELEIAEMLSGKNPTETAVRTAREMLDDATK